MQTLDALYDKGMRGANTAVMALVLSVAVTLATTAIFSQWLWDVAERRFEIKVEDIQSVIKARMQAQETALRAGVGFFRSNETVSRSQWAKFSDVILHDAHLSGLEGYGYSEVIPASKLASHESDMQSEGFPKYHVKPSGKRDLYTSIIYLEPFSGRNLQAFGYDMWSEPTRREAMMRARDTGKPAVSGMVTLVQEHVVVDKQNGFLMYLPHYRSGMLTNTVEQRRNAILGFVYSPFRMNDLMAGTLGNGDSEIDFRIFDANQEDDSRLLYSSATEAQLITESSYLDPIQKTLSIGGHEWLLVFSARSDFVTVGEKRLPYGFITCGLIISILLFFTIRSLGSEKQRAFALATRMTEQLREAKEQAELATFVEIDLRRAAQQANGRLRGANEELSHFSSIVAHDLRAPLKRIESFVDVLREDYSAELESDAQDVMTRLERSSRRMRDMLDAFQDYTKFGQSRQTNLSIRLNALVHAVLKSMEDELEAVTVVVEVSELLEVEGDHLMLEHVLSNLIDNATKFHSKNKTEILISAKEIDGRQIEVSVTDNGIGVEKQYHSKIFEMFSRLHDEDEYQGTGIGLAVCKRIISDHEGEIFIDPSVKKGTRVCFTVRSSSFDSNAEDVAWVA
ncbi:CHASE domain-containing protein [Cohaesibacter celericrescens]|uniref:histidine kinase n=1 Tax=Cohaesibacter celericrescens TaxID=2067669 RepID=A0A2N5XX20_9HYPH|nr:CHASE domain-containing protein [Cohaesibacter celericrescens]PLW79039.1 hypothetical protein C0081_02055 [Cohaesibacter celericrescens]